MRKDGFILIVLIFLLLNISSSFPQDYHTIDSLENILKTTTDDSTQIMLLAYLSDQYRLYDKEKTLNLINKAVELSKNSGSKSLYSFSLRILGYIQNSYSDLHSSKKNLKKSIELSLEISNSELNRSFAYVELGTCYRELGNYDSAYIFYNKALEIYLEKDSKTYIARAYHHLGNMKWYQGDFLSASELFEKIFPIYEETGDISGKAYTLNSVAILYFEMEKYDKALEYYREALDIFEDLKDLNGKSTVLLNTGEIYWKKKIYNTAIENYTKSLTIATKLGDESITAYCYSNLGIVYYELGDFSKADKYYKKAMDIWYKIENKTGIIYCLNYIGLLNIAEGEYLLAIENTTKCLEIGLEIGSLDEVRRSYETLSKAYAKIGNYKKALQNHIAFKENNDSIFNTKTFQKLNSLETKYEMDKQNHMIEMQQTQLELQNAKLKQQATFRKLLIAMLAAIIIVVVLITYAYFQKRKHNKRIIKQKEAIQFANVQLEQQKEEIEAQRDEIEAQRDTVTDQKEKIEQINEEMTDSIKYAEHIQSAILPQMDLRDTILSKHFILFKPRNIVSGDFYWLTKVENRSIIAAADCTGHGVPGAFMSMLGVSYLNEIVNNEYITHPGVILRKLRKKVIKALQQKGTLGEQRDGMDISLCSIDYENLKLEFSGANNPLYIIRRNGSNSISANKVIEDDLFTLYEIKGDKMPIALYDRMDKFQTHEIQLEKGDNIYLFSDGYADQFGGALGKKYKYKPFKKLLLSICNKSMKEQVEILDQTFIEWQRHYEQVDDILVIGIRI